MALLELVGAHLDGFYLTLADGHASCGRLDSFEHRGKLSRRCRFTQHCRIGDGDEVGPWLHVIGLKGT